VGRRHAGAALLLVAALMFAACDSGGSGSDAPSTTGRVQMEMERLPTGYAARSPKPVHARVCAQQTPSCAAPSFVATANYNNSESRITVSTANGHPTDAVPPPDASAFPGTTPERVSVRGHPGLLWRFDSADFELRWRERPGVWVRMMGEDVTHSEAEILALARSLRPRPWRAR
jgi:hypothetical protein